MNNDLPRLRYVHSDFLIHWTGKDIDQEHEPDWFKNPGSKTTPEIVKQKYIRRLKDILKYGLWMTKHDEDKEITFKDGASIPRPWTARTCFTELRVSETRAHAVKFGRLGIGFKRFFLFDRMGHLMVYYSPHRKTWFMPPFNGDYNCNHSYYSCFLKPMYERKGRGRERLLDYDFYDESEWRIIYSDEIKTLLEETKHHEINERFIRPSQFPDYYDKIKIPDNKPEYLIPLDGWFSMIIYPSLGIKNLAQADPEIKKLIAEVKQKGCVIRLEKNNWPIEINLDACRNF